MRGIESETQIQGSELKLKSTSLVAWLLLAAATNGLSTTHYVDVNSPAPTPPYTSWAAAATVIQDAVDAAAAGDEIVVTNGAYPCVNVTKPVAVRSINGPEWTKVDGHGTNRCVYLSSGATLSGLTLTNGTGVGGGVFCASQTAVVSNCLIVSNAVLPLGITPYETGYGGGAYQGTLNNCALAGNSAICGAGAYGSTLNQCALSNNFVQNGYAWDGFDSFHTYGGYGAGAYGSALNGCTVTSNSAVGGGGVAESSLNQCVLVGNLARGSNDDIRYNGLGGGCLNSKLNDCVVKANSAIDRGGGAFGSTLTNCSFTGNSASSGGAAFLCAIVTGTFNANSSAFFDAGVVVYSTLIGATVAGNDSGVVGSTLYNSVTIFNGEEASQNYDASSILNFCCTSPLPTNGFGNITNAPLFVDLAGGNFRLQSNSPCVNAGNNAYTPTGPDLDGNPRTVGGTVDIGAYEFQSPASIISYAWLEQYGFPLDGSADFMDSDGDGMNNWQEWRCGTDPTDSLSALRLLPPTYTGSNVTIMWQSVVGVNYFLERSTNPLASAAFAPLATNIPGQPGITAYQDANVAGAGIFLYRVGVW